MKHPRPGSSRARTSLGLSLVELLVATAIGALLLGALTSVAREGVLVRSYTRTNNEAVQQARFALQRVAAAARTAAPHSLLAPNANSSGDWFAPLAYCVNGSAILIETTPTDTGCTGTQAIATGVESFAVALPAVSGALDSLSAVVTISVRGGAEVPLVLSERLRLGGGTK